MQISRIIVGIDESPASVAAMQFAAHEAALRDVPLTLIHAWQVEAALSFGAVEIPWVALEADARTMAEAAVADAIGETNVSGDPRHIEVIHGVPGPVLVGACEPDDLLVVGTRVNTGLRRVLHGSVSRHCLNHAPCPVLAVPAPD